MYREVKILIFILVVLVVLSGCIYKLPSQESQQIKNLNESWTINTINRIHGSRGLDGGYSDFPPETPTLYSTYHFLKSLNLFNEEPKHKQATVDWLISKEQEMFKQDNHQNSTMRDIYFLTMSLDMLGTGPTNTSRLVSKVTELQMPDGSFTNKRGDEGTLLDTSRAIYILNSLGVDLNDIPLTKEWLISKWIETEENTDLISSLSDTYVLISTLELYGINISTLQGYGDRMEWLEEQKSILESSLNSLSKNQMDLFTLNSFTEMLVITDGVTPEIKSNVGAYLKEKQSSDGGFNALLDEYGESQGTRLAIKIASNIGLELNNNIYDFIYSHELSDGGFRPANRLLSSPENTYLAVLSLKFLGSEPSDKEKLLEYLEDEWEKDITRAKDAYYLLTTYKLLNQSFPDEKQAKIWVEKRFGEDYSTKPTESLDLGELYYLTKLTNILDLELDNKGTLIPKLQSIQNNNGGFGFENSDTYTTFLVVGILRELGAYPKDKEGCASWIKEGQIDDGGFIIRRGEYFANSSDLYSTYMSVVSLKDLDAKPEDVEGLLRWLKDCQDETGGFRLAPKYSDLEASPNSLEEKLEYTGWGLKVLDILDILQDK